MKESAGSVIKYIVYILSAIILGKSVVYLFMRMGEVLERLEKQEYIPLGLLLFYLLSVMMWSSVVLFVGEKSKIFGVVYVKSSIIICVFSLVLYLAVHASYMPFFQPFEFVYFINEISVVAFVVGILCLIVSRLSRTKNSS